MPLSANFRREMLMAIKKAKKNKEKPDDTENTDDGATSSNDTEETLEKSSENESALVLTKPISSQSKDNLNIGGRKNPGAINLGEKPK